MTDVDAVRHFGDHKEVVDFLSRDRLRLVELGNHAVLRHAVVQEKGVVHLNAREVARLYPQVLDHETELRGLSQLVVRSVGVLGQVHQQIVVVHKLYALGFSRELLRRHLFHSTPHLPHCRVVAHEHQEIALLYVFFNQVQIRQLLLLEHVYQQQLTRVAHRLTAPEDLALLLKSRFVTFRVLGVLGQQYFHVRRLVLCLRLQHLYQLVRPLQVPPLHQHKTQIRSVQNVIHSFYYFSLICRHFTSSSRTALLPSSARRVYSRSIVYPFFD